MAAGGGLFAGGGGLFAGGPFATGLIAGGPFASGLNAATQNHKPISLIAIGFKIVCIQSINHFFSASHAGKIVSKLAIRYAMMRDGQQRQQRESHRGERRGERRREVADQ